MDEAVGLAVGLGRVGPKAQVAQAEHVTARLSAPSPAGVRALSEVPAA